MTTHNPANPSQTPLNATSGVCVNTTSGVSAPVREGRNATGLGGEKTSPVAFASGSQKPRRARPRLVRQHHGRDVLRYVGERPHTTRDGREILLTIWERPCLVCGERIEVTGNDGPLAINLERASKRCIDTARSAP